MSAIICEIDNGYLRALPEGKRGEDISTVRCISPTTNGRRRPPALGAVLPLALVILSSLFLIFLGFFFSSPVLPLHLLCVVFFLPPRLFFSSSFSFNQAPTLVSARVRTFIRQPREMYSWLRSLVPFFFFLCPQNRIRDPLGNFFGYNELT